VTKRKSKTDKATEPVEVDVTPDESEPAVEIPEDAADVIEQLQSELAEAQEGRKRALADFANYQRRAAENERRAGECGAANVVRSLLGALDNFDLALDQDMDQITVEQLTGGVKIVRDELAKALATHGVQRIQPEPGDEFDPNHHEAMLRQPSDDVEPNHIVSVLQPGYTMGSIVLRPAKVAVAAAAEDAG
jgi:molecular chaperone GrpE